MVVKKQYHWWQAAVLGGAFCMAPALYAGDAKPSGSHSADRTFDQKLQVAACLIDDCTTSDQSSAPASQRETETPQLPERPDSQYLPNQSPSQQLSNQQAQPFNFGGGPLTGVSVASSTIPAMLGDFFGSGESIEVRIPRSTTTHSVSASFYDEDHHAYRQDFVIDHFQNGHAILSEWGNTTFNFSPSLSLDPLFSANLLSRNPVVGTNGRPLNPSWDDNVGLTGDSFEVVGRDVVWHTQVNVPVNPNVVRDFQGGTAHLLFSYLSDEMMSPLERTGNTAEGGVNITDPGWTGIDEFYITGTYTETTYDTIRIPLTPSTGRVKLAENSSPLPQDRIMFNYSYFHNVDLIDGGMGVNRYTPGFEKTFWGGNASLEFRAPVASTMASNIVHGNNGRRSSEFGDIMTTLKFLLYGNEYWALSGGLGVSLPTADGMSYTLPNGETFFNIQNKAVHLMPYLGGTWTPNERLFAQAIFQIDTPATGNDVYFNSDPMQVGQMLDPTATASRPEHIGKLNDPTFMYLDINTGYWLYRADPRELQTTRGLTGLAGMLELHYNRTLNSYDGVTGTLDHTNGRTMTLGNPGAQFEQLNLVVGSVLEFGGSSNLSLGYAVPVTSQRVFDGEFRCNFTYLFGGSAPRNAASSAYRLGNRSL